MPRGFEDIAREALDLSLNDRLALATLLLESADDTPNSEAEAAWDLEIRARVEAIEEGRVTGVSYEDAMREAQRRLSP